MLANNSIHTNPPLCITEDAAGRGLRDHRRAPWRSPTRRSGSRRRDDARPALMAGVAAAPPANDRRRRRRRLRPLLGFLTRARPACSSSGRSLKVLGGERWKTDSLFGTGLAIDWMPPFKFAFATDVKLPHTWVIAMEFVDVDAQRPDDAGAPARRGALHAPQRGDRVRPRVAPRHGAGHRAGPRPAARAIGRADHRGQPDHPDHRHRAAHRHRAQGGLVRCRDRVDLPDVLPGDDRRAARPARLRPEGARADALVRGIARGDPAQAAAPGVPAVPLHRRSASRRRPRSWAPSSASCRR